MNRGNKFEGGGKQIAAIRVYTAAAAMPIADVANGSSASSPLTTHDTCENIEISGNTFTGFSTSVASSVGVVQALATVGNTPHRNLTVTDNKFFGNKNNNDPVPNDGQELVRITNAERVQVSRNTAHMQRRLVSLSNVVGGSVDQNIVESSSNNVILVSACTRVGVENNEIAGTTGSPAIVVGGGTLCSIHGNLVASASSGVVAIRVNGGATRITVEGNTIVGDVLTLNRAIEISGTTTGVIVKNNNTSSTTTAVYLKAGSTAEVNTGNETIQPARQPPQSVAPVRNPDTC